MNLTPSRRAAVLAGVALAVGSLPLLTQTSAANAEGPATTTYTKALTYTCDVSVSYQGNPLVLEDLPVTANVSFAAPALKPNGTVAPTDVNVALDMGETLRSATVGLLDGVAASGASTNVYLFEKSAEGSRRIYNIPKLSAEKSDIPTTENTPWIINATGKSPEISVFNTSKVSISAPEKFDISATIYKKDETTQPVGLACETETDRTVATINVGEKLTMTPLVPATVKKGSTTSSVVVKTTSSSTIATGQVYMYVESGKQVGGGDLNSKGNVRLALPKFGQTGKRTLKFVYSGDDTHGAVTVTKSFTVTN